MRGRRADLGVKEGGCTAVGESGPSTEEPRAQRDLVTWVATEWCIVTGY